MPVIDQILNAAIWIVVIVTVFIIFGYLFWVLKVFKYRVKFRLITENRVIVKYDKGRLGKLNGAPVLYFLKNKKLVSSVPPAESIEITDKGKMDVEAYVINDTVTWITDKKRTGAIEKDLKTKAGDPLRKKDGTEIKDKKTKDTPFDQFPTNQRLLLIMQLQKAEKKRGINWMQHIGVIASGVTLIMMVVLLLMFWSDIQEPLLQAQDKAFEANKVNLEILQILERMEKDIQQIQGEQLTQTPEPSLPEYGGD